MKGSRPTIRDVARIAGVSPAAVSKVLRGAAGVSEQMEQTVNRAIAELNYRPKTSARALRGSSYTIGLVLPGLDSSFFATLYDGIADEVSGTPYRVIISTTGGLSLEEEHHRVLDLLDRQVDGLLLVAPQIERSTIESFAAATPVVVVARHDRSTHYDSVYGDDQLGTELVMQHLFDLGHRSIVHIANHGSSRLRHAAPHGDHIRRATYQRMMEEAGHHDDIHVIEAAFEDTAAQLAVLAMFDEGRRPTAIFAGADEAAFGALRALASQPEPLRSEVAVVGYDNSRFADHPKMSLTSVDAAGHELGRKASSLLLDRIQRPRPAIHQSLTPRLVVRDTSVAARTTHHSAVAAPLETTGAD